MMRKNINYINETFTLVLIVEKAHTKSLLIILPGNSMDLSPSTTFHPLQSIALRTRCMHLNAFKVKSK